MHRPFEVWVTPRASADIEAIQDYISQDRPLAAVEFTAALLSRIETLRLMPSRYPLAPESKVLGCQVRSMPHPPYRVLYRIVASRVEVLRVRHAARGQLDASE